MVTTGDLEKYYLPYICKDPLLSFLYDQWKKGPLAFHKVDSLKQSLFPFVLYPDAGFIAEWHRLFPDVQQRKKEVRVTPRQRSRKEAKEKLRDFRKSHPEAHYRLFLVPPDSYIIYSESVYLFMWDQLANWGTQIVNLFHSYYQDRMQKKEEVGSYVKKALLAALLDNNPWQRLALYLKVLATETELDPSYYWGAFWRMDVTHRFKEQLYEAIGHPTANLREVGDEKFLVECEKEWLRALEFLDSRGDLHIMPLVTPDDMVRYANLPGRDQDIVYQMIDYVVLKICPKLWQTLDYIESIRFHKWQNLLLGLMRPLVDEVVRQQERIKNEGRPEALRQGLTEKEERELRQNIESRILKLATEEYYYLYGTKQIPRDIRILMKEIESNQSKLMTVTEKGGSFKEKRSYIEKDKNLTAKLLQKAASWVEGDSSWIHYCQLFLPWGHFIGLPSDEEMKEIMRRGAYPRKALLKRIENLKKEYGKTEEGKDWGKARELASAIGKTERELETGESVLQARQKSRGVRPSYFLYRQIQNDYSIAERIEPFADKGLLRNNWQDEKSPWAEALDARVAEESLAEGAMVLQGFEGYISPESLTQKQFLDKPVVVEDESGHRQKYVRLGRLADKLGCSPKTLIRMEERGDIEFEWKRIGGGWRTIGGRKIYQKGRRMRLFPVEKIEELEYCFKNDKDIAKDAGVRADYLPKLKKKLGLDELPRCQQKKKLIE